MRRTMGGDCGPNGRLKDANPAAFSASGSTAGSIRVNAENVILSAEFCSGAIAARGLKCPWQQSLDMAATFAQQSCSWPWQIAVLARAIGASMPTSTTMAGNERKRVHILPIYHEGFFFGVPRHPNAGSLSEIPNRKISPMMQLYAAPVHAIA